MENLFIFNKIKHNTDCSFNQSVHTINIHGNVHLKVLIFVQMTVPLRICDVVWTCRHLCGCLRYSLYRGVDIFWSGLEEVKNFLTLWDLGRKPDQRLAETHNMIRTVRPQTTRQPGRNRIDEWFLKKPEGRGSSLKSMSSLHEMHS